MLRNEFQKDGSNDSPGTYIQDMVPIKRTDLLVLQRKFSEQVVHLEEEMMADIGFMRDSVKERIRQHSQTFMSRQQELLEKPIPSNFKCLTQGSAASVLLSAREDISAQNSYMCDLNVPQLPLCATDELATCSDSADDAIVVGDPSSDRRERNSSVSAVAQRAWDIPTHTKDEALAIDAGDSPPTIQRRLSQAKTLRAKTLDQVESIITLGAGPLRRSSDADELCKPKGMVKKIEQSVWFATFCAFLLITNTCFIGNQVEYLASNQTYKYPLGYVIVDCMYTICFLVELMIRMVAADSLRTYFTKPGERVWNWTDFIIILISVFDTCYSLATLGSEVSESWTSSRRARAFRVLRLLRMIRVVRVIRAMRYLRSLRVLIYAIAGTMKSGTWTAILMCMIVYLFALGFCQATTDHLILTKSKDMTDSQRAERKLLWELFGTFPRTYLTLFKSISGGIDWEVPIKVLVDVSPFYVGAFSFYIAFMVFAVLNVVTGLFLHTALEQAQNEVQDVIYQIRRERDMYVSHLKKIFQKVDKDQDNQVTLSEFETLVEDPTTRDFFMFLDLEISDAWTLFRLLDNGSANHVNADDFVDGCLRLRGHARSLDIAQMMHKMNELQSQLGELQMGIRVQSERECLS